MTSASDAKANPTGRGRNLNSVASYEMIGPSPGGKAMRSERLSLVAYLVASVVWLYGGEVRAATFTGLGDLPGGPFQSIAWGVSADGQTVVGTSPTDGSDAFKWTAETGILPLPYLSGGASCSGAYAASSDGTRIAGFSCGGTGDNAVRWTGGVLQAIGDLAGGNLDAIASDISADGSVLVGRGESVLSTSEAFRWVDKEGFTPLGFLSGETSSMARGVSADGNIVVGSSGPSPFIWTLATGMLGLDGIPAGEARGISADGAVVIGSLPTIGGNEAFLWTESGGVLPLGNFVPGGDFSQASATSADGSTVVGTAGSGSAVEAFIWDATSGMQDLQSVLEAKYGLDLTDWNLVEATGVSDDGLTIVGYGNNPSGAVEGWIANPPEPGTALLIATASLELAGWMRSTA